MIGYALCHLELPPLCQKSMVVHINLSYSGLKDSALASGSSKSVSILMLIESLFSQVFNKTFYGIMDATLSMSM